MSVWSPALESRLAEMVGRGHTSTEISAVLGVSRSAVIGKVHRMGLAFSRARLRRPQRPGSGRARARARSAQTAQGNPARGRVLLPDGPAPEEAVPVAAGADPIGPREAVTLMERQRSQCPRPLWPDDVTPTAEAAFVCGAPTAPGSNWCAWCHTQVFQPRMTTPHRRGR
ncbi:GcrA family cell cycle regulator [Stappia sp. ICDLI1TA098]